VDIMNECVILIVDNYHSYNRFPFVLY